MHKARMIITDSSAFVNKLYLKTKNDGLRIYKSNKSMKEGCSSSSPHDVVSVSEAHVCFLWQQGGPE